MARGENHESVLSISVNERAFNAIASEINKTDSSVIPQPILLVGEEGSGKSTLLTRLREQSMHQSVSIDGRYLFKTQDIMDEWVRAERPPLIIIDDWDYYLSRADYDDQYRLRRLLYNEGAPMMIAAVSKIVPALVEYKAPFFEGLDFVYTEEISEESLACFFDVNDIDRVKKLWSILPKTITSILRIKEVIAMCRDTDKDMDYLIASFSEKFRNIYQNLPQYSQMIINCLNGDLLLADIRKRTGLQTGILTPYLTILKKNGIIKVDKTVRRKTKYSIKDPLFKLWLRPSFDATGGTKFVQT